MHTMGRRLQGYVLGLCLISTAAPLFGASQRIDGNLAIVPDSKLPPEARVQGDAMMLHLVDLETLYLYIEQADGHKVAVFDVRNPRKIKFKKLVPLDVPGPFDFVSLAAPNSMLIRFRDGSGDAILDLRKPTDPQVRALSESPIETYIIPVIRDPWITQKGDNQMEQPPTDYQVVTSKDLRPIATVRSVIQKVNDPGSETTYLLGAAGLTVIRNTLRERQLAEQAAPPWTNTFDDY